MIGHLIPPILKFRGEGLRLFAATLPERREIRPGSQTDPVWKLTNIQDKTLFMRVGEESGFLSFERCPVFREEGE